MEHTGHCEGHGTRLVRKQRGRTRVESFWESNFDKRFGRGLAGLEGTEADGSRSLATLGVSCILGSTSWSSQGTFVVNVAADSAPISCLSDAWKVLVLFTTPEAMVEEETL